MNPLSFVLSSFQTCRFVVIFTKDPTFIMGCFVAWYLRGDGVDVLLIKV